MSRFIEVVGLIAATTVAVSVAAQQSTTVPPAGKTVSPSPGTAMAPTTAATALPLAASSNLFEIESSQLALQRSQSPAVKEFATRMVADHTLVASKMKAVLSDAQITPPPEKLNAKHQKVYESLKAAQGPAFDKAYIEAQYNAHVEAVNLCAAYAKNGDNARLKALAAELLPALQRHLDHVSKLRTS
jgi:putative membrane protein